MPAGRHFLQIPGPTNVPDRVLRAIDMPTMDHRGPDFAHLGRFVLEGMQRIIGTRHPVVIYPASGTGAWEAALVNTLSPGDHVLMYETGHFATLWHAVIRGVENSVRNRVFLQRAMVDLGREHLEFRTSVETIHILDHKDLRLCGLDKWDVLAPQLIPWVGQTFQPEV